MPNANADRLANGKFAPGNKANKRALPAEVELEYRKIIMRQCTPDQWAQICDKAIEQARGGDRYARDWLTNYLIGKPIQTVRQVVDKRSISGKFLASLTTDQLDRAAQLIDIAGNSDLDRSGVIEARVEEIHTRSVVSSGANDKVY